MKLIPQYSYEYNKILNPTFNEQEQIKNFASLLSDKDRFLPNLNLIEKNADLIAEKLGYKLNEEIEFYIVRAEQFKSFSIPITIEYSILPEEMMLFLLKEIIKSSIQDRFFSETQRDQYINSFIEYIIINGDFEPLQLTKFTSNLHEQSKKEYQDYQYQEIDFSKKTIKQHIEELFGN